jgi:hypothetical protein
MVQFSTGPDTIGSYGEEHPTVLLVDANAEEPFGYAEASLRLAAESSPLARPALIV